MNIKKTILSVSAALICLSTAAQAQNVSVSVENLTNGIHFTPLLIAMHDSDFHLFKAGERASNNLQTMAEGGEIGGLSTDATASGATIIANPAGGMLAPGAQTSPRTAVIDENTLNKLSITAMMLPTNDGFIGLDSWSIPKTAGTYTINVNAYDAGTEANTELLADGSGAPNTLGIPVAPSGHAGINGTGVTTSDNNINIHIHRGNLGDTNATGGFSDLDSTVHRWLNPVARITVTVQ